MAKVTLKELKSRSDWFPLRFIRVKPEQRRFTTNIIITYLQATHPSVTPYTIHLDDKLIGYVLLIHAENPAQWIIERLTIDKEYQRQGYGYEVADQLIDMIHEFENSEMVIARYDPDNEAARSLFAKLKFVEQEKKYRNRNLALLEFEFEEEEVEDEELDEDDDDWIDEDDWEDDEDWEDDDDEEDWEDDEDEDWEDDEDEDWEDDDEEWEDDEDEEFVDDWEGDDSEEDDATDDSSDSDDD